MNTHVYKFCFDDGVDLDEAELTLHLAIHAAEGLYGEALVRMEAGYRRDETERSLYIDGATEVGQAVVRIFTSFVIKEFGSTAFTVSTVTSDQPAEPLAIAT